MFKQGDIDWASTIVASLSFIVSVISLIMSSKAQKLQDRINEVELHIKEYNLKMINQELASKISSWIDLNSHYTGDETIPVVIANNTDLPIYDVVVSVDLVDDNSTWSNNRDDYTAYTFFVPPGNYYIYVPWHGGGMNKKFNSTITFRDAKGDWWCRDATGAIEESVNSLDKYGIMRPADSQMIILVTSGQRSCNTRTRFLQHPDKIPVICGQHS